MANKIEKERQRLKQETGMDFGSYQKPQIAEQIGELIDVYQSITGSVIMYTVIFLVITAAAGYYLRTQGMGMVGIVVFASVGILFSLIEGPSLGVIKSVRSAVGDSGELIGYMLDVVKEIKRDVHTVAKDKPESSIALSNILRGVSYEIFIPTARLVVKRKFSLLAGPVNFISRNVIFYFTKSLAAAIESSEKLAGDDNGKSQDTPDNSETEERKWDELLETAREKIEPLADTVGRTAVIPAKVLFTITVIITVPLFLLIYIIF